MTLSSLVVSRDWQEVSILECILGGLHIDVSVEGDPQQALSLLSKSKIDALIVDCDLPGSSDLLRQLQLPELQAKTCPLVIMGGTRNVGSVQDTGALFAFEKPISVDQAVRTLSAARNTIVEGRLRYHRAGLRVPVSVKCPGQKVKDAQVVNLSQGGMLIRTRDSFEAAAGLQLSFALPGVRSYLKAKAQLVWQDDRGNHGVRFLEVPVPQQRTLQLWLAQQFLTN